MREKNIGQGFTLIELLVVVLIIGILAAVALPQYQAAVAKSRYATLKNLTNTIASAEETYYLANGSYAGTFDKLDIEMPGGKLDTSTSSNYKYDWGSCWIGAGDWAMVTCQNDKIQIAYRRHFDFSTNAPSDRLCCIFGTSDLSDWRNKICKMETKRETSPTPYNSQICWTYLP